MRNIILSAASLIVVGGLAMAASVPVHAQSQTGVALNCGTNFCEAAVSSPASPQPFKYSWSYTGIMHSNGPLRCGTRISTCGFYCNIPYSDRITMHVSVADANGARVGTASANAVCDGSVGTR